jgi:hypothetical protein
LNVFSINHILEERRENRVRYDTMFRRDANMDPRRREFDRQLRRELDIQHESQERVAKIHEQMWAEGVMR